MKNYLFKMMRRTLGCAIGAVLISGICDADDPKKHQADVEYFETHIRPLLAKRCYSCHSSKSGNSEGGLQLDSREGWLEGGDNGTAIVAGDADASLLVQAIRYDDPNLEMPPDRKLSDEEIQHLEKWVRRGAFDPRNGEETIETPKPSDPVAGRSHWAFQPLRESSSTNPSTNHLANSEIDRFVLNKLDSAGLKPNEIAGRRTLIRRVSFALTGLPPEPSRVAEFVNDSSPAAYQKLVDEVIESPQFGERWGRHWLDLARYADSNGLDENFLFREAWRYRNWVIGAINDDLPYDEFLTQQIAGDLLPYDSTEQRDTQRIAAGYLVLGPKVLLGNPPDRQRMEIADEQLDTIGKSVLGLTMGCARCHDHKFDPIPTANYYAMAGILTSTQVMERRYMLGQQRVMEQLIGLGDDGDALDTAYEAYWRNQPALKKRLQEAKRALELLVQKNGDGVEEFAKGNKQAVTEVAADSSYQIEQRIESQKSLVAEISGELKAAPPIPPRAMTPTEREEPHDEQIRLAGEFDQLGKVVPRGFLEVLTDEEVEIPEDQSGRLELAEWLTDVEHGAGRLAARVLANRVWQHLIGVGIVRTVDNFGRTGEAPSHPELLDFLAQELTDSDWSLKHLVRTIVMSQTFRMSSDHQDEAHAIDPGNRLLWRAHRRRLDPESMRDAVRMAAGTLSLTPMDSTVDYLGDQATAVGANKNRRRTDFPCRSVYLPVIRNDLPELFDVFDFADPHATTGMRPQTMVPTQSLYMLNSNEMMAAADAIASQLIEQIPPESAASRVDRLYELLLNDVPDEDERIEMLNFIESLFQKLKKRHEEDAELRAWSLACQALIASSRFQFLR